MAFVNPDTNYVVDKEKFFCSDCFEDYHSPDLCAGTPPLDEITFVSDQNHPFSCIYLLNLFLAPDMARYLQETSISDNVYDLPIHMQKLIAEAKMEALLLKQEKIDKTVALDKLNKVRTYVRSVSGHDSSLIIKAIHELIKDEDELNCIIGE